LENGITVIHKQLKWSQEDLAKKVGTSAPIIGRYECNEIKPSIEIAKKIADELGVTVDYLLGGSEKMVLDKKLMKRIEDIEALLKKKRENLRLHRPGDQRYQNQKSARCLKKSDKKIN
jgi:transcriptional regulator with XRE-family HTH domain